MRVLAIAIAVVAAVSSAAESRGARTPGASTLPTAGPVTMLAADGPRAAAVVSGNEHGRCAQIVLWRPGSRPIVVRTRVECGGGLLEGVDEIALGGDRVLWQETNGGNNLELIVNTAAVANPRPKLLSYVENGNGAAEDPGGDCTGHLLADGPLLVFA